MRFSPRPALKLCLLLLAVGLAPAQSVEAKCPNCFTDADPLNTTKNQDGSVSTSSDGRPRVSWRIDGSWDAQPGQTNVQIWNAADAAFNQWNTARGVNNEPSRYSFHREQQWGEATITLIKDTRGVLGSSCMRVIPKPDGRFDILMKPESAGYSMDMLIDYIKHEVGHTLGLAHPTVQDMRGRLPGAAEPRRHQSAERDGLPPILRRAARQPETDG